MLILQRISIIHSERETAFRWNEEIPAPLKALVERCWDTDYERRPNFDEVCDVLEAEAKKLPAKRSLGRADHSNPDAAGTSSNGCCVVQ